jgi:hypothetical protein
MKSFEKRTCLMPWRGDGARMAGWRRMAVAMRCARRPSLHRCKLDCLIQELLERDLVDFNFYRRVEIEETSITLHAA